MPPLALSFGDAQCRGDRHVWIEGDGVDALAHEPFGKVGIVGWGLPADANGFLQAMSCLNRPCNQPPDGLVPLVEQVRDKRRIAIEAQRQLRQIVRANREAIELLQKWLR
jgi:hypothetical protein